MSDEVIKLTADVVAVAEGKVLLIKRGWDPFKGCWALPGGHVDEGETARDAARRELDEETGVIMHSDFIEIGAFHEPGRDPRGRYVTVAYRADLEWGVIPFAGDDAVEARWWPLDALPPLAFDHADIIAAAVR
jgi:8-oxo-dGTP diphosphatase